MKLLISTRLVRLALVAIALPMLSLSVTSCGPKSAVGPNDHISPDQAAIVAQQLGGGLSGGNPLLFVGGMFGGGRQSNAQGRLGRPMRASAVSDPGMPFQWEFQAYDAADQPVDWDFVTPDVAARISMRWKVAIDTTDAASAQYLHWHGAGHYDIGGLLTSAPEVTMSGASKDSLRFREIEPGTDLSVRFISDVEVDGVRIGKSQASWYPLAGRESFSIDLVLHGTQDGAATDLSVQTSAVMAFNGTVWADLLVDGKYHYQINLETGEVRPFAA